MSTSLCWIRYNNFSLLWSLLKRWWGQINMKSVSQDCIYEEKDALLPSTDLFHWENNYVENACQPFGLRSHEGLRSIFKMILSLNTPSPNLIIMNQVRGERHPLWIRYVRFYEILDWKFQSHSFIRLEYIISYDDIHKDKIKSHLVTINLLTTIQTNKKYIILITEILIIHNILIWDNIRFARFYFLNISLQVREWM